MVNQRRDEEWAVELFRPLIQKLRLQEKSQSPVVENNASSIHIMSCPPIKKKDRASWLVSVQKHTLMG